MTSKIYVLHFQKASSNEFKDCRTIRLMPHSMKLLPKIIQRRIRPNLEYKTAEEQFGFRSGNGTTEGIFTLQTLCERAIEMQSEVFISFIDYEKAFDKVQHKNMKELLGQNIDKNNRIIKSLY